MLWGDPLEIQIPKSREKRGDHSMDAIERLHETTRRRQAKQKMTAVQAEAQGGRTQF